MNEAETRRRIVDQRLTLAGWNLADPSQVVPELDVFLSGHRGGSAETNGAYDTHPFADYGLMLQGRPALILETKRTSKDAEAGQEQGLQYAQSVQVAFGGSLPFVMYGNGHDTFYWESDFYPPVKAYGFPTRDDLEWMAQRRDTRRPLSVEMIDPGIAGRGYQIAAIRTILEAMERKRRRLIQFIRHILGLERLESWSSTVGRAFTEFIAAHSTLTAIQIEFLRTLETYVLQTGKVEKKALVEDPFTRIHPKGIRGVFAPAEIDEVLRFAQRLVA